MALPRPSDEHKRIPMGAFMGAHSRILAAAAVAVAVLAAAGAASDHSTEARSAEAHSTEARSRSAGIGSTDGRYEASPPAGWRLESSIGAQIAVPANWAVNDSGCGMTANPSVVRGKGLQTLCDTSEPPTKDLAIIEDTTKQDENTTKQDDDPPKQDEDRPKPGTATTIDTVPAQRGEKRLPDGRYAGWISVPSRHVTVDVRTRDPQTTERILHSLQLVDTDHLGCATRQPPKTATAPSRGSLVAPDPKTIAVCYYGGEDRLQASAEIRDDAQRLAAILNAAPPGRSPDRPAQSCDPGADPPGDDAILLMRGGAVRVRFSTCTGRGIDNGARTAQLTPTVIATIMAPVHVGYSISGDLPG